MSADHNLSGYRRVQRRRSATSQSAGSNQLQRVTFGERRWVNLRERQGGGGEVQVKARIAREPSLHRRGFVSAIVVHDQMDVECGGQVLIDSAQELQELATAVAPM